jgi:hypothetical protein
MFPEKYNNSLSVALKSGSSCSLVSGTNRELRSSKMLVATYQVQKITIRILISVNN